MAGYTQSYRRVAGSSRFAAPVVAVSAMAPALVEIHKAATADAAGKAAGMPYSMRLEIQAAQRRQAELDKLFAEGLL